MKYTFCRLELECEMDCKSICATFIVVVIFGKKKTKQNNIWRSKTCARETDKGEKNG